MKTFVKDVMTTNVVWVERDSGPGIPAADRSRLFDRPGSAAPV
jgi:hypothetical protein